MSLLAWHSWAIAALLRCLIGPYVHENGPKSVPQWGGGRAGSEERQGREPRTKASRAASSGQRVSISRLGHARAAHELSRWALAPRSSHTTALARRDRVPRINVGFIVISSTRLAVGLSSVPAHPRHVRHFSMGMRHYLPGMPRTRGICEKYGRRDEFDTLSEMAWRNRQRRIVLQRSETAPRRQSHI